MTALAAEALVVGGGPAGLTSAIALARAGLGVRVYESRSTLGEGGSGLTLWPNALRALDSLGLGDAVRAAGAPVAGIAVRSWQGKMLSATSEGAMRNRYGDLGVAIERAELLRALVDAVPAGTIALGTAVAGLTAHGDGVTATLEGGSDASADLIVGADGMRSRVRVAALGAVALRPAGYTVWRGLAAFRLEARAGTLSMGRGAQFGLFPMPRGRVYWFASLPSRRRDAGLADLIAAFAGWHEPVEAVIAATDPASIIRTDVEDARPLRRRAAGRVVLVGDAAHPSTPALGQGACQAIEDAVVLGNCLQRSGGDVAAARADYERRRVRRTNAMTVQARRMGRIGQWRSRPASWVRDRLIAAMPERIGRRNLDWQFSFDDDGLTGKSGS